MFVLVLHTSASIKVPPTLHRKCHRVFVQEDLVCHGLLRERFKESQSREFHHQDQRQDVGERQQGCGNHRAGTGH